MGRRYICWILAAALSLGLAPGSASAEPSLKEVGTDAAGDWFGGAGAEVGEATSQDLIQASIGAGPRGSLIFQVKLAAMAAAEQARLQIYSWEFQLSTDDATVWHRISPVISFPDGFHFVLSTCRTINETVGPIQQTARCDFVEDIEAEFDVVAASITWSVPVRSLTDAKRFTVKPNGTVYASSWFSVTVNNSGPHDFLHTTRGYRYAP